MRQATRETTAEVKRPIIYWARAAGYQIANFKSEKRDGGQIVQPEEPLRFHEHILTTYDPKVVKFIEKSRGFGIAIHKCETMGEAAKLTAQHRQRRDLRVVKTKDVTSTEITD